MTLPMTSRSGVHAGQLLGAAAGDAEAGDDLVEDEQRAGGGRALAQQLEEARRRAGRGPCSRGSGSARMAANSCSASAARDGVGSFHGTITVVRRRRRRDARAGGERLRREAAAGLGQQAVDVAVVGAGELQELLAARGGAREADRRSSPPRCRTRSCAASRPTGMRRATSSASSTSPAVGAPKLVPRAAAATTAARTSGWAWPWIERAPGADPVDVAVAVDVGRARRPRRARRRAGRARSRASRAPASSRRRGAACSARA